MQMVALEIRTKKILLVSQTDRMQAAVWLAMLMVIAHLQIWILPLTMALAAIGRLTWAQDKLIKTTRMLKAVIKEP